jgi:hypothetical protein
MIITFKILIRREDFGILSQTDIDNIPIHLCGSGIAFLYVHKLFPSFQSCVWL